MYCKKVNHAMHLRVPWSSFLSVKHSCCCPVLKAFNLGNIKNTFGRVGLFVLLGLGFFFLRVEGQNICAGHKQILDENERQPLVIRKREELSSRQLSN